MNKYITKFLCSFFELFDAYIIKIDAQNEKVKGIVHYSDNSGLQEFEWSFPESSLWSDAIFLLEFISMNKHHNGDKVAISSEALSKKIGKPVWSVEKVDNILEFIFSIKVQMKDNGRLTDSFFIHS